MIHIMISTLISLSGRLPVLSTNDGQAHLAFLINVGVVDLCFEANFRWFEWIFCREVNLNAESTLVVRRIVLKSKNADAIKSNSFDT